MDSSDLRRGGQELDSFARKGEQTERRVKKSGTAMGGALRQTSDSAKRLSPSLRGAGQDAAAFGGQMKTATGHTANMFAQVNDIGVMLASGQSPLMLAVQQGSQINQIFAQTGGSTGRIALVGHALKSMISPMNLLTIATIAGGSALAQWGLSMIGVGGDVETLEDQLGDLEAQLEQYRETLDLISSSTEIEERFGAQTEAARELYEQLAEFQRLNTLDEAASLTQGLRADASIFGSRGAMDRNRSTYRAQSAAVGAVEQADGINAQIEAMGELIRLSEIAADKVGGRNGSERVYLQMLTERLLRMQEIAGTASDEAVAAQNIRDVYTDYLSSRVSAEEFLANNKAGELAAQAAIYGLMADTRTEAQAQTATAQGLLSTLQDQAFVRAQEAAHGSDSFQAANARLLVEGKIFTQTVESLGVSQDMEAALYQAWLNANGISAADFASPISAGASEAARLAQNLGIALDAASRLAYVGSTNEGTVAGFESADPRSGSGQINTSFNYGRVSPFDPRRASVARTGGGGGGSSGGGGGGVTEAEQHREEVMRRAQQVQEDLLTSTQRYEAELADLQEMLDLGALSQDEFARATELVKEQMFETEFEPFLRGIEDVSRALADAIVNGENLGDALGQVFKRIAADLLASGIQKLLTSAFSSLVGGPSVGGLNIAGARADGGPVGAGQTYLVGERGPELFTPNSSGNITANGQFGGGAVRVVGGDLTLGDNGQIMAQVEVVAASARAGAVQDVKRQMRYRPKTEFGR